MWNQIFTGLSYDSLTRIGLTLFAGFLLGIERERHGRAAGLRTTLLVSLSSCVIMMISDSFYLQSLTGGSGNWHPDPARLAAGALSGMGFLGAGVIIRQSSHLIRGVTTAATLWFSTVLGLAFGSGAIGIGILGTLIAFIILYLIPSLEAHIQDDWYSDLSVRLDSHASSLESLLNELKSFPIRIKSLDIQTSKLTDEQQVVFHLKYKKVDLINFPIEVTMRIGSLPGVRETHWHA